MHKKIATFLVSVTLLTSCATYNPESNSYSDPLSGFNKKMFDLNYYVLDPYIARPIAVVWRDYIPVPIRTGFVNISSNLSELTSTVNSLLEGEAYQAGIHITRFFINTLFGLAGSFDVASMIDPELQKKSKRSFGYMLGSYGVPYGPYVVLPFYDQATLRDDGGFLIDRLYSPLTFLDWPWSLARAIVDGIESRAVAIDYEYLLEQSDDPYNFMRNAYFQRHDFEAQNHKVDQRKEELRQKSISGFIDDIDAM